MVFAGATLLAAVCGLALTGISFLAWLGYSAGIVVALALLAALTLVPALLGLMGLRVLPKSQQRQVAAGDVLEERSDEVPEALAERDHLSPPINPFPTQPASNPTLTRVCRSLTWLIVQ
jgi:uncharacterized membrane protein YdfJ with MMPL/SSD domain